VLLPDATLGDSLTYDDVLQVDATSHLKGRRLSRSGCDYGSHLSPFLFSSLPLSLSRLRIFLYTSSNTVLVFIPSYFKDVCTLYYICTTTAFHTPLPRSSHLHPTPVPSSWMLNRVPRHCAFLASVERVEGGNVLVVKRKVVDLRVGADARRGGRLRERDEPARGEEVKFRIIARRRRTAGWMRTLSVATI
jgi:hypothetical protein